MHKSNQAFVADLFLLSLEELQAKHHKPKDQRSLDNLRRYYRKKLRMENTPDLEKLAKSFQEAGLDFTADELSRAKRAGFHVGYIRNSDGEIEYTKPLPHVDFSNDQEAPQVLEPATPANIKPTRRKPIKRDHEVYFVFSDMQIDYRRILDHDTGQDELVPIHDERAMRVARLVCKDVQPDEIINLGDSVDLAALSKYPKDSDHFYRTLSASFQRVHDYLGELRADNPTAKITEVDSNHNVRLRKFLLGKASELYDLRQASSNSKYPVMSYPFLANLGHLGVNWVGGYGGAEYSPDNAPDLIFKHGDLSVSRGSTAAKLSSLNPDVNVVQGHAHRIETATRTTRAGKYLSAVVCGALCKTTGEVPAVHSAVDDMNRPVRHQENWQQGVLVICNYGNGNYDFDHILINNGRAFYGGKEYDGND